MNKGLRGKSYLQRRVMETLTMQCLELSSGCSQEKVAGWEPGHKHNGAGGATVRSYLNYPWVFINSFYNTDHSRAEVLVTFISVSNASQQQSHPEMLVAIWLPQSELWKSVPNECIIGHQKSSVTFMFPHPFISFPPADSDAYTKLTSQAVAGCVWMQASIALIFSDRPTLWTGSGLAA